MKFMEHFLNHYPQKSTDLLNKTIAIESDIESLLQNIASRANKNVMSIDGTDGYFLSPDYYEKLSQFYAFTSVNPLPFMPPKEALATNFNKFNQSCMECMLASDNISQFKRMLYQKLQKLELNGSFPLSNMVQDIFEQTESLLIKWREFIDTLQKDISAKLPVQRVKLKLDGCQQNDLFIEITMSLMQAQNRRNMMPSQPSMQGKFLYTLDQYQHKPGRTDGKQLINFLKNACNTSKYLANVPDWLPKFLIQLGFVLVSAMLVTLGAYLVPAIVGSIGVTLLLSTLSKQTDHLNTPVMPEMGLHNIKSSNNPDLNGKHKH